jgi:hypothetical protein
MWTDLFLDRVVDDDVLAQGLARLFGVSPTDVGIVDDIGEASAESVRSLPIRVERAPEAGDFPLRVSVYLDYVLQPRVERSADEETAIARLCALWQCSCLFSDDDVNPYSWLLMRSTGLLEAVTVDGDRLDDQDELVVARIDGVVRQVPLAV